MTARVFPAEPSFESSSEELFACTLRDQLPDDAVLICNQNFSDRTGDREADVIVGWPGVGFAVIEIKGGSVYRAGGQWRQSGNGVDRVIHPVDQARACKHLLRDYLAQHRRWHGGEPRIAHLVALPATTLPDDFVVPDLPRWMAIDKTDVPHAATRVQAALRKLIDAAEPPLGEDVDELVDCLAGAGIPQRDLVARLVESEAECELLTREQATVLEGLADHHRVEIRGGAGSGKTWLAVEKARRLAAGGQRVALMCYSRGLAQFLERRVAADLRKRERPAYVGTFHGLGIGWGVEQGGRTTTATTGRSSCPGRWNRSPLRSLSSSGSTRSSSTRRRTSPRAGGRRCSPRSGTRSVAAFTSSPTRGSASSLARGGRRSTWSPTT